MMQIESSRNSVLVFLSALICVHLRLVFLPLAIDCDRNTIDRFYFDRFLDSANTNEQDRVASISIPFKAT